MSSVFKALGIAAAAFLLLFGALMIDWDRSSAKVEEDVLIARDLSPDKQSVAEIHLLRTAMHSGPDKIYATISKTGSPASDRIYERTYECDDLSAFRLQWDSRRDLRITYGKCDAGVAQGKGLYKDFNEKQQNKVWRSDIAWQDVRISYEDTKYVATH
jgi:hypothetical protein